MPNYQPPIRYIKMSVHQVEEYYIHINEVTISESKKEKIEELIIEDRFNPEYTINVEEGTVRVDDFECEGEAMDLEEQIMEVIEND